MKTITVPHGKVLVDEVETLTTLYQSHLRAFIQGLSFSHTPISDNAVGRFRTWYNQNPEIAAQQKGVYSEEQLRRAIGLSTHVKPHHVLGEVTMYSTDEIIKFLNQENIELEMVHTPISPNGNIVATDQSYPFANLKSNFTIKSEIKTTRGSDGQLIAYLKK